MGGDDAGDGFAIKVFVKYRAPVVFDRIVKYTGINNCPPVAIAKQPDIDVVEPAGHGHADPEHTWGNLEGFADSGCLIFVIIGQRVKAALRNNVIQ